MVRRKESSACGILSDVSDQEGVFAPAHRPLTIGILVSITVIAFEGLAVATVLPVTATELGGLDAYGWAFSAFMLASLLGAIAAGQMTDRRNLVLPARLGWRVSRLACWWLAWRRCGQCCCWAESCRVSAAAAWAPSPTSRSRVVTPSRCGRACWRCCRVPGSCQPWSVLRSLGKSPSTPPGGWCSLESSRPCFAGRSCCCRRWSVCRPRRRRRQGQVGCLPPARLAVGVGLLLWGLGLGAIAPVLVLAALGLLLAPPALRSLLPMGTPTAQPGSGGGRPRAASLRLLWHRSGHPAWPGDVRGLPPSVVGFALTAGALTWVSGSWLQDRDEAGSGGSRARGPPAYGGCC